MQPMDNRTLFATRNIRHFILFSLFFNARFYYPVFTILFLDFGLTLEQFAILNAAWAATIVLLEVPSGALADVVGRKNLLVAAGFLMIWEMVLLCILPRGNPNVLFGIFLLNRIFSGTAQAAASGADEALAYDTLKADGKEQHWPKVLARKMRIQSIGFIVAMTLGAAVYDPDLIQAVIDTIGLDLEVSPELTLRLPLVLTLVMAILALSTALKMQEVVSIEASACGDSTDCRRAVGSTIKVTLHAGLWILKTPFASVLILTGLVFDHVVRLLMTLTSQYFRLIELPEASFGLIGSGMAAMGLLIPRWAAKWAQRYAPVVNFAGLAVLTMLGLYGLTLFIPVWGVVPMVMLSGVMFLLNFYMSHYLNRITPSAQRATVLSFKGLSMNLAYGGIGLCYSALLAYLREGVGEVEPGLSMTAIENAVFVNSLNWFPWYFLALTALLAAYSVWRLRHYPDVAVKADDTKTQ